MKFYLKDTNEYKTITIRPWNDDCGYGLDCFDDLEPNFPADHIMLEDDTAYICTAAEYAELAEWWEEEVRRMNAREDGQSGAIYDELQGDELVFCAD